MLHSKYNQTGQHVIQKTQFISGSESPFIGQDLLDELCSTSKRSRGIVAPEHLRRLTVMRNYVMTLSRCLTNEPAHSGYGQEVT